MEAVETPKSSTTSVIVYYRSKQLLEVSFRENQSVYQYFEVPNEVWNNFKNAESKGFYLNTMIKGNFQYKKIR